MTVRLQVLRLAMALVMIAVGCAQTRAQSVDLPPLPRAQSPFLQDRSGDLCDALAAADGDTGSTAPPVGLGAIRPEAAAPACEAAVKAAPDHGRYIFQLGRVFEARRDDAAARDAYAIAAARGHVLAALALARLQQLGRGGPHDLAAALKTTVTAAETGHPRALAALALLHQGGIGTAHDLGRWIDDLTSAAEAGSMTALRHLGIAYAEGLGVPRNKDIADDLFLSLIEHERPRANADIAEAIWVMGWAYDYGAGVTKDANAALRWFRRGEALADADAIASIGWLYERGAGVALDKTKACDQFERAALAADGAVLSALGWCFLSGEGRGKDIPRGIALLERAVAAGDALAARNLGRLHDDGQDVPRDRAKAGAFYRVSAERGLPLGMSDFGFFIRNDLPDGKRKACDWYERAAERGLARGMNNLAACYSADDAGRGRDIASAIKWYENAAALGDGLALRNLGDLHLNGIGVARNEQTAVAYYQRGANAGDAGAMVEYGMLITRGIGAAADVSAGCTWFEKAAAQGNRRAMNNIGACFANGEGRTTDVAAGLRWYERAVEAGDAVAMANLGDLYSNGRGVPRDSTRAVQLFRRSADAGYAGGAVELAAALYHGNGIERDPAAACGWYDRAAAQNHPAGHNGIGVCFEYGIGRKRDLKAANAAFARAADAGSITALRNLVRFADRGIGGPKDTEAAAGFMRKAFERGNEQLLADMISYPSGWSRDTRRALQRSLKRDGLYDGPLDGFFSSTLDQALWERVAPTGKGRLQQSFTWAPIDGTQRGLLVRVCSTDDKSAARRPLVVINHGLTTDDAERRDMRPLACSAIARFFVDRGFTVAIPLRRGYGETAGRFSEGGTRVCATSPDFVAPGLTIAADIQATIAHMTAQADVAASDTIVIGHSGGGWGALALASRNAPGIAGIVNISGVHGSNRNRPDGVCGPDPITKSTRTFGKTARQPTLWIYAENDSHAGPRLVRRMFEGFRREGGNATLAVLPPIDNDGHNIFDDDNFDLWSQPLDEWLTRLKQ